MSRKASPLPLSSLQRELILKLRNTGQLPAYGSRLFRKEKNETLVALPPETEEVLDHLASVDGWTRGPVIARILVNLYLSSELETTYNRSLK